MSGHIATAATTIDAPRAVVWTALTDPEQIAEYMFGSVVETDWKPGSAITWSGEWEGKPYQDKGEIVEVDEPDKLVVTHYSPLTGQADVPENYHTIVYALTDSGDGTEVTLTQDGNGTEDEAENATKTWGMMLDGLKKTAESHA